MIDALSMAERHARDLAELTAIGLESVRDLRDRQLAAEDADVAARAALALHRVMRGVRQSMALEAKLDRDRLSAERDARNRAAQVRMIKTHEHRERIRHRVERLIWDEAERSDAEELYKKLDDLLDEAELDETFLDQPVERFIARFAKALGVNLPLPPQSGEGEGGERAGADDAATPWRSSA